MIKPGTYYSLLVIKALEEKLERLKPGSMMYSNYSGILDMMKKEDKEHTPEVPDIEDPNIHPYLR